MIGVSGGTFDPPPFWYKIGREVFMRYKAPFLQDILLEEKHETISYYNPKNQEPSSYKDSY
ncbi:MAG: hypothetical protein VYE27_09320 [Pseudomonadota bacterium]|nr:hypothetical protein [Pseudomonadota bacterium]